MEWHCVCDAFAYVWFTKKQSMCVCVWVDNLHLFEPRDSFYWTTIPSAFVYLQLVIYLCVCCFFLASFSGACFHSRINFPLSLADSYDKKRETRARLFPRSFPSPLRFCAALCPPEWTIRLNQPSTTERFLPKERRIKGGSQDTCPLFLCRLPPTQLFVVAGRRESFSKPEARSRALSRSSICCYLPIDGAWLT